MKISVYNAEGEQIAIPAYNVVCPRCDGTGSHVNPSVDGNGITSDEMDELGEDFLSDYLGGVYDVVCYECNGKNVVAVADELRCTAEELAAWNFHQAEEWLYDRESEMERRAGC